jgi:acetyl esterase/lipase
MQDTVKLTVLFLATLLLWTGSQSEAASEKGDTPNAESKVRKREAKTPTAFAPEREKKLDVPYKTTAEGKLCMDVYYPAVQPLKNLPTLIYTHGGGWPAGKAEEFKHTKCAIHDSRFGADSIKGVKPSPSDSDAEVGSRAQQLKRREEPKKRQEAAQKAANE